MKYSDKLASVGAATAALVSISCCLPFGITAAFGLAGLSMFASAYQVWLIAASVVLLIIGIVQLVWRPVCQRRSRISIGLLVVAAVSVVAVTLFPESIAGFLADRVP